MHLVRTLAGVTVAATIGGCALARATPIGRSA